jgi:GDP-4-dehydro-6-deoxy-D-mannose reductase
VAAELLITGARGFVGRHVLAAARARGLAVVAADGDLRDAEQVERLVADTAPAAVIHLAATWGRHARDPWRAAIDDVTMTGAVVRAVARRAPGAAVLAAGSAAQYGMGADRPLREDDPLAAVSPYGAAKTALERLVLAAPLAAGVRMIWARSFNHLGPGQGPSAPVADWAIQVAGAERAGGGTVRAGRLDVVRDLLDVRDVACAYLALVLAPAASGAVNVCSGRPVALAAVMDELRSAARAPVEVVQAPELIRATDPPFVVGDPGRLAGLTGWQPAISLAESVRDVLDEQRRSPHAAAPATI